MSHDGVGFRLKENFDRHMATAHNPAWIESHTQSVAAAQPPFKRKLYLYKTFLILLWGLQNLKQNCILVQNVIRYIAQKENWKGISKEVTQKPDNGPVQRRPRNDSSGPYAPIGML